MLKILINILCDLDPKVKVIDQKAGICDGVPSTSALVYMYVCKSSALLQTHHNNIAPKGRTPLPPFLAHLSRRLMGELIVYQSLRRPSVRPSVRPSSVRQHFQTSSPLKPLGQSNSNFIWRLLRTRERKFVQMVLVTWPRWPPCPYMVKTL